jgi:hypothetical protein
MKILVLGGYGQTGRPLVRHLVNQTRHEIVTAGRHLDRAEAFAATLATPRVTALQVDARDATMLGNALQGVDLVLVACPTTDQANLVVEAAIRARADYLDVQLSESKLQVLRAHEAEIRDKGLCFVTEAGFHPGLPAALVRYAASKMENIEAAVTSCFMNLHGELAYTEAVDELTDLFLHYRTEVYTGGRWSKPGSYVVRKVDFGPGIGRRGCYSMYLEELRLMPQMYPTLQDTGLYVASTGWVLDIVTMALLLALKVSPRKSRRALGKMLWWAMTSISPPPYGVVLQVDAKGMSGGEPKIFRARLTHRDGYEFTAIPVAALLMQYDHIRTPGLYMMGHICDTDRLVADMRTMGIEYSQPAEQPSEPQGRGGVL